MLSSLFRVIVSVIGMSMGGAAAADTPGLKSLFGWLEPVRIDDARLILEAKLDTGATTSSIDAREVRRFRRGVDRVVKFRLVSEEGKLTDVIERPLVRVVRIKRHGGEPQRRPVIKLTVCFGALEREVEFSLVNRNQFDQPVLLGRNALEGFTVIDPELSHTSSPDCHSP